MFLDKNDFQNGLIILEHLALLFTLNTWHLTPSVKSSQVLSLGVKISGVDRVIAVPIIEIIHNSFYKKISNILTNLETLRK